jgi:hypothetical protein
MMTTRWVARPRLPTRFCSPLPIVKSSRRVVALFITAQFAFVACADVDNSSQQIASTTTSVLLSSESTPPPVDPPITTGSTTTPTKSIPVKPEPTTSLPPKGTSSDPTDTTQSSAPPKGSQQENSFAATDVLSQLMVSNEVGSGYDRDLFRHWVDDDGDDCDTRQEVLIRDSQGTPQIDPYRCKVIAGDWYSPYDGATWENPSDVDIDHVVALKEAWDSGAWQWSSEKRRAFANDLSDSRSLMAVTDSVNQSKGDRDPSQWMPPRRDYRCTYISLWLSVKARWSLSVDPSEAGMIRALLDDECRGLRVAKWAPTPIA